MNAGDQGKPGFLRYEHRGALLEAPGDWVEDSMFTVQAPGTKPQPVLTLVRTSVAPDVTLETFVGQRVAELAKIVAGLEVEQMRETTASGLRAIALRQSWDEPEGRIIQRLLFVRVGDSMFLLTGTALDKQYDRLHPVFEHAAANLKVSAGPR